MNGEYEFLKLGQPVTMQYTPIGGHVYLFHYGASGLIITITVFNMGNMYAGIYDNPLRIKRALTPWGVIRAILIEKTRAQGVLQYAQTNQVTVAEAFMRVHAPCNG